MADLAWTTRPALDAAKIAGRHGSTGGEAGVMLSHVTPFSLVQVMARRGQWERLAAATRDAFGAHPPEKPGTTRAGDRLLIWSGPDQFHVLGPDAGLEDPCEPLRPAFAGAASLSDQSDGRCLIGLSGPKTRETLAKLCSLDLHLDAFPPGAAAATSIDHTAVLLWRESDDDAFCLLVFTTFAESLWHAIVEAAAEFGAEAAVESLQRVTEEVSDK